MESQKGQISGTGTHWRGAAGCGRGEARTAQPPTLPGNRRNRPPWVHFVSVWDSPPLPEGVWAEQKCGIRPCMS